MFENLKIKTSNNSSDAVYLQIKRQLENYLSKNKIKKHTRLPDVKTLSQIASVSIGTMEKTLQSLIRDNVCYRRPKKGTFVGGDSKDSQEILPKTICGILHSQERLSFEGDLLMMSISKGIQSEARARDIDVVILTENSLSFYESCPNINFLGVFLVQWQDSKSLLELANKHPKQKFVTLNYVLENFNRLPDNIHGVFNADFTGSYEAVTSLARNGHKHFALVSAPITDYTYDSRVKGMVQALSDNQLPCSKDYLFLPDIQSDPSIEQQQEAGKRLVSTILAKKPKTSAIVCVNDVLAAGIIEYLEEKRLRHKIEVVGYDNILPFSQLKDFSTVSINFEQMGTTAVQILANNEIDYPKILTIPPTLLSKWHVNFKEKKTVIN